MGSSRYGNSAARASSSVWMRGLSEKRTDLGDAMLESRSDFLRKEEDDVTRGLSDARAKSLWRDGSFGCEMVSSVLSVTVPRNCDSRSLYCCRKLCSVSCNVREALSTVSSEESVSDMAHTMSLLLLLILSSHL